MYLRLYVRTNFFFSFILDCSKPLPTLSAESTGKGNININFQLSQSFVLSSDVGPTEKYLMVSSLLPRGRDRCQEVWVARETWLPLLKAEKAFLLDTPRSLSPPLVSFSFIYQPNWRPSPPPPKPQKTLWHLLWDLSLASSYCSVSEK